MLTGQRIYKSIERKSDELSYPIEEYTKRCLASLITEKWKCTLQRYHFLSTQLSQIMEFNGNTICLSRGKMVLLVIAKGATKTSNPGWVTFSKFMKSVSL